jgi:indole-3-glycerol phosphate synthase
VTILDEIVAHKRLEAAGLARLVPPAPGLPPRRSLLAALCAHAPVALIAEIKRRSPSRPLIRETFEPESMARAYEAGGAAALSVLTDKTFFGGSLAHLEEARGACTLPVLRKDFIIDERQVAEAKLAGADAILLIAACLDDDLLHRLRDEAARWDLEVLVEVHDEGELARVLALDFPLIGVNNRDLKTFKVDLGTTERLAAGLARSGPDRHPHRILVSESGISSPADIRRLLESGCGAALVGEALLIQEDLTSATRTLLGAAV